MVSKEVIFFHSYHYWKNIVKSCHLTQALITGRNLYLLDNPFIFCKTFKLILLFIFWKFFVLNKYLRIDENADQQLDRLFKIFSSRENDTIRPKTLNIKERNVRFSKTCGRVADCTFDELCDRVSHQNHNFKYLIIDLK